MRSIARHHAVALLGILLVTGVGVGQEPVVLLNVDGAVSPEGLGSPFALDGLGDVDGDAIPDFVAGAPNWPMPHPTIPGATIAQVGRAGVFSGATGAALFYVYGTYNLQALGKGVANVGDLDGDGRNDVAIGAPMFGPIVPGGTPPPQQVQVWSSGTQTLLFTILGGAGGFTSGNFGAAIAGIGDVGSLSGGVYSAAPDGYADILVGAPDGNGAYVHSGADGALLYSLTAATLNPAPPASPLLVGNDGFGHSVAGVGDVNSDGVPDFLVGARSSPLGGTVSAPPNTWYAGAAFLFSGAGGALLQVFVGNPGDNLGYAVAGAGDADGDLVPDFAISAIRSDAGGTDSGSVTVYSGVSGTPLWSTDGVLANDTFGWAVAGVGDVDQDGVSDLVVGSPGTDVGASNTGSATLLSGQDGSSLGILHGANANDLRGRSVSGIGDVDGDGFAEVAVGAPGTDVGGSGTGSVALVSFGPFLRHCSAGNIPAAGGGTFDMLLVNGTAGGRPRRVDISLGQPFTLTVQQPSTFAAPAPFYLFGFVGIPGVADEADPGAGIGTLCFLPPVLDPLDSRLFLLADSILPFDPLALFPATTPAPWSLSAPSGLLVPAQIAVQAVALDGPAILRSNAVLLDFRP